MKACFLQALSLQTALQNIQKTRRHSIDFCHFWRYNEAVCEYVSSMPRADAQ